MQINGHWIHNLNPYAVKFPNSWPLDGIRWYGVAYLLSFLAGYGLLHLYRRYRRLPLSKEQISSLLTYLICGVIVGGRLGYVLLYDAHTLMARPAEVFYIWHGGMSSHGGFVGVAIALFSFAKRHAFPPLLISDAIVSIAPVGIFLGRLANFINGEAYGRSSSVPWAVIFPQSAPCGKCPITCICPRHPSQIYEALTEGLLLLIVMQISFWSPQRKDSAHGSLTAKFLIIYSLLRIFVEFLREPDAPMIFGFSRGQFYSIFTLLCGVALSCFLRCKGQNCHK
jgi:phosphatidylglycerol:prolipoprotein diacylglycerol transferase